MSGIEEMAARLREISQRLREPGLDDEEAERLAREAAELAASGGAELDSRLRELAERGPPEEE